VGRSRRGPGEVFQALVDPAITTRFWFTKSSGKVVPGAELRWDWEMYGASANVSVKEIVSRVAGSTGGFSLALCALKALLEHDVVLTVVLDRYPKGLEL
jgi:uncharacterized protein YndB with AHSA1/START domain